MIHISKITDLASRTDKKGIKLAFSLKYVKVNSGEIITIENAILTSSHHSGTINVKILDSAQIRKLTLALIIEFNHTPVYM
jgi:hypothetical protein